MDAYIQRHYQFVKEHAKRTQSNNSPSILEQLWQSYSIGHTIDCENIRMHFQTVENTLSSLSQKRQRILLRTIIDLCLEHERIAFLEGIQIGVQLSEELTTHKTE